jgi:preprotein translocase subunit SecA
MRRLDTKRLRHFWNTLRGIPIEWDLAPYEEFLSRIETIDLAERKDDDLKVRAAAFRELASQRTRLDDLLVDVYALVREAAHRTVNMRPFDVQVLAGIAMHQGKLVEMLTGEGKTLVAVFPAVLNALSGQGVHIHTFNDYLARRDAAWMGPIYEFLGLSVGCIQEGMSAPERRRAYACDITYSTAKEAGFDYLRDQLCFATDQLVHRSFHFVIVDEADSILIDEARVPLVIAGSTEKPKADPGQLAQIAKSLREGSDFETDEGKRNIYLSDTGLKHIEDWLSCGSLHARENLDLLTRMHQALHAEYLLRRDVDYIVRNEKVEIVDEFTGRVVEDRHWPDGLQAAVEAKEKLRLGSGGSILGSITLQHFLKLYPKISGMTATARPSAAELHEFYGLNVVVIPPNRPCVRDDREDVVFTHKAAKLNALSQEIAGCRESGRPVLVGTASVEESEELAAMLEETGITCQVLNAKNDELEADVIARAGRPGAVTISTNMAGRGVDIKLGGDDEQERDQVVQLGGLYVIGTNRHESLRIDRQLRGRSGRQGDPGSSRFFVSLEDPLIERYGLDKSFPKKYRTSKQERAIESSLVHSEMARGQRVIEGQNFDIRKKLWRYSSFIEDERKIVQDMRQRVLLGQEELVSLPDEAPERYKELETLLGKDEVNRVIHQITLFQIDRCWREHLAWIADVREGIHLAVVGGRSPLDEFHRMVQPEFSALEDKIKDTIVKTFESLTVGPDGVDLESQGIRGPSSTWTYLVSDHQFGLWVGLIHGTNIGAASLAVFVYWPLYIAMALVQRFFKRKDR